MPTPRSYPLQPLYRRPGLAAGLNALLALAAVLAVTSLVLQYGGFEPATLPVSIAALQHLQFGIVAWFVLDRLLRLLLAWKRKAYLKDNWLDYALMVVFAAALLLSTQYPTHLLAAGTLFVAVTQVYILMALLIRLASANVTLAGSGLPPSWLLIGSFAGLVLIGSGLLMLPAAVRPEFATRWHYPEALFTATSATCVTGLVVVDTGTVFTTFGQAVILVLFQLGGLGIMIFGTMLAMLVGKNLSMRGSEAMGAMLGEQRIGDLARVVRFVVTVTLLLEMLGAVLLYAMFRDPSVRNAWGQALQPAQAAWYAVFHSVSAFCNAGFSLYAQSLAQGAGGTWPEALREHWQVMGVVAPLIVLGGLGFPVLLDLWTAGGTILTNRLRRLGRRPRPLGPARRARLSLHSKMVLLASAGLIVLGAAGLLAVEVGRAQPPSLRQGAPAVAEGNDWVHLDPPRRVRAAVFQSVTARTAGFNTIDPGELSSAGKLWLCGLMFIGGSPASTAGGVKTTTVALTMLCVWCVLFRRNAIEAFGRTLRDTLLRRAVTLLLLYGMLVGAVTLLLCVTMRSEYFIDLLFEACSACGTVGLSTGITDRLPLAGKFVVIAGMFIGRVGPLTLVLALTAHVQRVEYSYPTEDIVIG